MVILDRTLAEVLSMLVDGAIIRSAYFIKDNIIIAYWPPDSLNDEVIELSKQVSPISRYDTVLLIYGRRLSSPYIALTLGYAVLLVKINKEILCECRKLAKILNALSSFSERVNLIITS